MTVGINIDLDEVEGWLEAAQKAPELMEREAAIAMELAVGAVERKVVDNTPVNIGALEGAWHIRVRRGQGIVKGEIVNPLKYAIVIEKGRSPNSKAPPVSVIQFWVSRKFGIRDEKIARGLAFYIAKRIGKHGFAT